MGATSVTGVGQGGVFGLNKGAEGASLSVKKLLGAHVVAAGNETLVGTTGVVEVPAPAGVVGDYFVALQTNSATAGYVSTALAAVADTGNWTFTVTAASNAVVNWMLVAKGV